MFETFVFKVASRCNLNCSYCYVYSANDSSWKRQPTRMTPNVASQAARVIRDHCLEQGLKSVNINFHGGEPLLIGLDALGELWSAIQAEFVDTGIEVASALQSNGVLLDAAAARWLMERDITVYLSLDGPPDVNDKRRLDHGGRPTWTRVREAADLLSSGPWRSVFGGFLAVIDPTSDPSRVLSHLLAWDPPILDLLLPLHTRDTLESSGQYGAWLIKAFDHWWDARPATRIRTFDTIMSRLLRGAGAPWLSGGEALIVETNGELELDDTLKVTYEGACRLGYDVFQHNLTTVTNDPRVRSLNSGRELLSATCASCHVRDTCRGGHIAHRYSRSSGFSNPSVYCADLESLTVHIHKRVSAELGRLMSNTGSKANALRQVSDG